MDWHFKGISKHQMQLQNFSLIFFLSLGEFNQTHDYPFNNGDCFNFQIEPKMISM